MNITQVGWILNMVGLLISVWGSYLLAKGTPRDTPDLPPIQHPSLEYKFIDYNAKLEEWIKRAKNSKKGFWLVLVGFGFQIVSQIFQNPF